MKHQVFPAKIEYVLDVNHDGILHKVHIPELTVPKCVTCGELLFDNAADDQISNALRTQLGLLNPEQISQNRQALGMSRAELAERIGFTEQALTRWEENRGIQTRAADNLLRLFFALPAVRGALIGGGQNRQLGVSVDQATSKVA
ncbi:MAG TPA: helix-turn-helix domain-containing protein [Gemmataceae bacterium]|nr:helix-turn-helix domain-containing protein [Gemmataceae bacterium]